MTRDDVIRLVADTLKADGIDENSAMGRDRQWDSLSQVRLMMALERGLDIRIPAELFGELTSVAAILEFLEAENALG